MMTTIRICEESDARVMMRDGTFIGYVEAWAERFPQITRTERVHAYRDRYGFSLKDAFHLAVDKANDEKVVLEIGDRTAVRKFNNTLEVLRKDNGEWWKVSEGLGDLASEVVFDGPMPSEAECIQKNRERFKVPFGAF